MAVPFNKAGCLWIYALLTKSSAVVCVAGSKREDQRAHEVLAGPCPRLQQGGHAHPTCNFEESNFFSYHLRLNAVVPVFGSEWCCSACLCFRERFVFHSCMNLRCARVGFVPTQAGRRAYSCKLTLSTCVCFVPVVWSSGYWQGYDAR